MLENYKSYYWKWRIEKMAWDDYKDMCDECVLYTGFIGTDKEFDKIVEIIECSEKEYCLNRGLDEIRD
jgi:hypothetical protein